MTRATWKEWIVGFIGLALLFALMVTAIHQLFTLEAAGANDFYPRYRGAVLFWQEGVDPYSPAATEAIQRDMYGRLALPEEDQVLFVYPFYVTFMLLPLVWLPVSYSWIQAIWLTTLLVVMVTAVLLTIRLVDWKMPSWLLALTLLWAVLFYNNARTIILGQFAAFVFLWLVLGLLALKGGRDGWAGLFLALTTIKPQMVLFVLPALLLWAVWQRRWRFVFGFGAAMAGLLAASFLLLPSWLTGFIEQVNAYPGYTVTPSPLWIITQYYFPILGRPVELGLTVVLVLYMLYLWRRLVKLPAYSREMLLILGVTMIVNNMVLVRTATTNFIVLYIPILLCLRLLAERTRRGLLWVTLFYAISIFSLWVLFLSTLEGDQEHVIMFLPLPVLLLRALIWLLSKPLQTSALQSVLPREEPIP